MRAADAVHDDPAAVPDTVYWATEYEADVHRLRRLGCRCILRCRVIGDRVCAVALNESVAAPCTVDHHRS